MQRREFLKATLATAGGVTVAGVAAAGCGDNDDGPDMGGSPYFPQSVASGDPRPNSVILWTRVFDPARPGQNLQLTLEIARDRQFSQRIIITAGGQAAMDLALVAEAHFDGCVKVRVDGLDPAAIYFYRFHYQAADGQQTSRIGRTKTAPAPDADVPVRFAVASCQNYVDKYFHSYRHMAGQDLDFFVHLGDYIYETTQDPIAIAPNQTRTVAFTNPEEALPLSGAFGGLAARSLSNYRDLYRIYRSDPDLQRVHELFPMIAVWDDHEFSNDAHGANGTYFDGRVDEQNVQRRFNADQAWFEYMPVDFTNTPAAPLDSGKPFPDNLTIYRDFVFGRHVHLLMTDLRRYRSDHLVPEDAFPGTVAVSQADLLALVGNDGLPSFAVPYVDIDTFADGAYLPSLRTAAEGRGFAPMRITGRLSVPWINELLDGLPEPIRVDTPPIDPQRPDLERGIAYHQLMKQDEFSSVGSRIFVRQNPFRLLARHRFAASAGASEDILGPDQTAWFLGTIKAATRTWKVWGNSFGFMQRAIDLTGIGLAPEDFRDRFLLGAEDWDGAPNQRDAILAELSTVDNVVVVTGDMHAFLVGTPFAPGDPSRRVIEVIAGSISSTPLQSAVAGAAASEALQNAGVSALALVLPALLSDPVRIPNPHLAFRDLAKNGYALLAADARDLHCTLYMADPAVMTQPPAGIPDVQSAYTAEHFRVQAQTRALFHWQDGVWRQWDVASYSWTNLSS